MAPTRLRFVSFAFLVLSFANNVLPGLRADVVSPDETPTAAEARLQTALAAFAAAVPDDTSDHLRADLAEIWIAHLRRDGDAQATVDLIAPVLARADAAPEPNDAFRGRLHHILAQAALTLNDAPNALAHHDQAIALLTSTHGPSDSRTLLARLSRAVAYSRVGRPADADRESIAIVEAFRDTDPDSAAAFQSYGQRAVFLLRLGRLEESEAQFRDLLARDDANRRLSYSERRAYLNNLAYLLNRAGRNLECVTIMEQIAAGDVAAFGPDGQSTLTARFNLAYVYGDLGRYEAAEQILREDLIRIESLQSPGNLAPSDYLGRLGELALKQGDTARAVPDLSRAHALRTADLAAGTVHLEDRTHERQLRSLVLARSLSGDSPGALTDLTTWLDLIEERFRVRLNFTSEADRLALAANNRPLDLPATINDPLALARAVLRFKGVVLDSILEDQQLALASNDPAVRQLLADYQASLTADSHQETANVDPLLGSRREQLERELARRTLTAGGHRRALLTDPAAVLAAIPPNSALVEFVHYRDLTPNESPTDAYAAVIGTAAAGWQTVNLGPAATIDPLLARYRILVRRGGELDWAREVRRRVLDPVRATLPPAIDRLLISPDGPLHQIAWASLPEDDNSFVLEHLECVLLTSGRDLLDPLANPTAPPNTSLVLAVSASPSDNLPALPGAAIEGAAVAALLPGAHLLTDDQATPAALRANPDPRWLHIASHAVAPVDPTLSLGERLRRTGLALAGTGGFFSASQVATLNLHATQVAFLSACDSGGGEVVSGEGILGLRRGFARAGAQALILTLWPVADDQALPLINHFYSALAAGAPPAVALAQAQRLTIADARKLGRDNTAILRDVGAYTISGRR